MKTENLTFSVARLPRIEFGSGAFQKLPACIKNFGSNVLLITGAHSFLNSSAWSWLRQQGIEQKLSFHVECISGEPSPEQVDKLAELYREQNIDVVVAIGGGSPLDAAKAIAGLLRTASSVLDFLEGVGPELTYSGPSVPFIAVPTTAGTGSECTKNAVLSTQGSEGFKKSFRDDKLVAEYAIVDPDLLISCPSSLIAANGMDALTQLLESYTSLRANIFTDTLAISGIQAVKDSLVFWFEHAEDEPEITITVRQHMAYASMLSGITLAQVGLGSVHGLASPLGAFFPIPHGVVCGTLVAGATAMNLEAIQKRDAENVALIKYRKLAQVLCDDPSADADDLVQLLTDWTVRMELPKLNAFGISLKDLDHIVKHARGSSMQTNPIVLTDDELFSILEQRL